MARKRFTTEQIIGYLREIDVTANTYYRWRKKYGGLGMDQARPKT